MDHGANGKPAWVTEVPRGFKCFRLTHRFWCFAAETINPISMSPGATERGSLYNVDGGWGELGASWPPAITLSFDLI